MTVELEPTQAQAQTDQGAAPPDATLLQLLFGKHVAYCVSAVARLGVPDQMDGAPHPIGDLAEKVGVRKELLYRVMRLLGSVGVFLELPGQHFALTPVSRLLKTGEPGSLRNLAIMFGDPWSAQSYAHITDCLRTGVDGVTLGYGKHAFDLLGEHPEWAENFHRAMVDYSAVTATAILKAYDFSGIYRLADVGGGHGEMLASVLEQYPKIQGVLYDRPEVVAGAWNNEHLAECKDRIVIESGDFFERVPSGCDAYLLKHIIHDWDDDHCRKILTLISEQLPAGGRVLLCEMVVEDTPGPTPAKMLDIEMLVLTPGGKERSEAEFRELLASARLRLTRIVRSESPMCIVEAERA
jgi:hypothetical protein